MKITLITVFVLLSNICFGQTAKSITNLSTTDSVRAVIIHSDKDTSASFVYDSSTYIGHIVLDTGIIIKKTITAMIAPNGLLKPLQHPVTVTVNAIVQDSVVIPRSQIINTIIY